MAKRYSKRYSKRRSLRTHRRTKNKRGGMGQFGARGASNLMGAHLSGGGGGGVAMHEIGNQLRVGGVGGVGGRKRMTRTRGRGRTRRVGGASGPFSGPFHR